MKLAWYINLDKFLILCSKRTKEGLEPFCTHNCPTKAMTYGDLEEPKSAVSMRMKELWEKGYRIFQLPVWERTRPEVYYAEK